MPKLFFMNKSFEEQHYELMVEKTTVGRGNHNTLVICDPSVSLTHCEILMNGPEIIVRDLDSSNGTFVDGVRLNKQAQAKSGQVIRFGLVEARLELDRPNFNDPSTSITAMFDMAKVQREKRREEKHPKPANIGGKVEPSAEVALEGHTVLIPRPPQPSVTPDAQEILEGSPAGSKKQILLIAAMVLVLAAVALLWWWMKGK